MHNKVAKFLMNFKPSSNIAAGVGALSFNTEYENAITDLKIYGNTDESGNPCGGVSVWGTSYPITLRIHGKNMMSGDELYSCFNTISNEDNMIWQNGDAIVFSIYDASMNIVSDSTIRFKENTQYTMLFRFKTANNVSNVGLKFVYTDGTEESIVAPSTELCDVVAVSAPRKTIKSIGCDYTYENYIYKSTFGIFEGVHDFDYFEEFKGQIIYLPSKNSLSCGIYNGITYYDRMELGNGKIIKYFENISPRYSSNISTYRSYGSPKIYSLALTRVADVGNHCSSFTGFTYYEDITLLDGNDYGYTFSANGNYVYFTLSNDCAYEAKSYMDIYRPFLQYKLKEKTEIIITPLTLSDIPKGYLGVSLGCSVPPSKIKVYYKK